MLIHLQRVRQLSQLMSAKGEVTQFTAAFRHFPAKPVRSWPAMNQPTVPSSPFRGRHGKQEIHP